MTVPPVRQTVLMGLTRDASRLPGSDEPCRSQLRELRRDVEKVGGRREMLSKRPLILEGTAASVFSVMLREMVLGR
jgi:hypothetical protein